MYCARIRFTKNYHIFYKTFKLKFVGWSLQGNSILTVGCGCRVEQEQEDGQAGNTGKLHLGWFLLPGRWMTVELVRMSVDSPPSHHLYLN